MSKKQLSATNLPTLLYCHKQTLELIEILDLSNPAVSKKKVLDIDFKDVTLDFVEKSSLDTDYVLLGHL